jgi:hypothetical protein
MDSSAIFGFAGVLVGAGSTYLAQRNAEQRRDHAVARAAVRLLQVDVLEIEIKLNAALESGHWWVADRRSVLAPHWTSYEAELAKTLLLRDWLTLRGAFVLSPGLQEQAELAQARERGELDTSQRDGVAAALARFEKAEETMNDLTIEMQSVPERVRARLLGKRMTKGK